jgi:hypothetical protein
MRNNLSTKEFETKLSKVLLKKVQKSINVINANGPKILRQSLKTVLMRSPATRKYAGIVDKLKSENRKITNPKIGAGVSLRIENNKLTSRIILSESVMEAFFPLIIEQYGRKALPPRSYKHPYALAIPYNRLRGKFRQRYIDNELRYTSTSTWLNAQKAGSEKYGVVFTTSVSKIAPGYQWMDKSLELAEKRMLEEIPRLILQQVGE